MSDTLSLRTWRKEPRQARSGATVETIFEATVQILIDGGVGALTTTRVAARAGVSVGTVYQYFPHKQALMLALFERHLDGIARTIERACEASIGRSRAVIAEALVGAFLQTMVAKPQQSRAAYIIAVELEGARLLPKMAGRAAEAVAKLLVSADDGRFADVAEVAFTVTAALGGAARALIEHGLALELLQAQRRQLTLMMQGYLQLAAEAA